MKITKIDGNGNEYNYGYCENINDDYDFCPNCGQKIDWEDK